MDVAFDELVEINIDDLLSAWGVKQLRFGQRFWRALARWPSVRFARQIADFDQAVGRAELKGGGQLLCKRHTGGVMVNGLHHLPAQGPLLVLSNHPGLSDTIALFSAVPRPDLRVIGLDRPFLRALPNTSARIFMLPDDPAQRAGITRKVAQYLRQGGAALTFPAGQIEPDPLVLPGAIESLQTWSESIGLFARLVPQLQIVIAIVGGVYTPAALRNPVALLRRKPHERELLAAALQIIWPPYQRNQVYVAFAPPVLAADLLAKNLNATQISREINAQARRLLENWPGKWQPVDLETPGF